MLCGIWLTRGKGRTRRKFAGRWACWGRRVRQAFQQPAHGLLILLDGCALAIGERDQCQPAVHVRLGFEQLRPAAWLGNVEVAAGAGHPVGALLEERVVDWPENTSGGP